MYSHFASLINAHYSKSMFLRLFCPILAALFLSVPLGTPELLAQDGKPPVRYYEYTLSNGNVIRGMQLPEAPRTPDSPRCYDVKLESGVILSLPTSGTNRRTVSPEELLYYKNYSNFPDTIDGQWELAELCRKNRVPTNIRNRHLSRIMELKPDDVALLEKLDVETQKNVRKAHIALGHKFDKRTGTYMSEEEYAERNGLVKIGGKWVEKSKAVLAQERMASHREVLKWTSNVKKWRIMRARASQRAEAEEKLGSINNPSALPALIDWYDEEPNGNERAYCLSLIRNIKTSPAWLKITDVAIMDDAFAARFEAITYLKEDTKINEEHYNGKIIELLKQRLIPGPQNTNEILNRAAFALGELGDTVAIMPLVNALVTKHTVANGPAAGGGQQYNVGFKNGGTGGNNLFGGGGGNTFGSPPPTKEVVYQNAEVLNALVKITGQRAFGYDKAVWVKWYDEAHREVPNVGQ